MNLICCWIDHTFDHVFDHAFVQENVRVRINFTSLLDPLKAGAQTPSFCLCNQTKISLISNSFLNLPASQTGFIVASQQIWTFLRIWTPRYRSASGFGLPENKLSVLPNPICETTQDVSHNRSECYLSILVSYMKKKMSMSQLTFRLRREVFLQTAHGRSQASG